MSVAGEKLLAEDTQSRIRALDASRSFIVEAPAGAGKTELLTQRFLRLLQTVQEPEEIIAITFTNKAASEMRMRILDSLQDAADAVPVGRPHKQQTRELALAALQHGASRGWRLLQNPARLRIYTIDSFSSHLARQMPLLSRFGAQPGVREDAQPYYEEAADRTLELLDTAGVGEVVRNALQYFDNDGYRLGQLLATMLAKRDQWLDYIQQQATPELAAAALERMVVQDMQTAAACLTPAIQCALMPLAHFAADQLPDDAPVNLLRDWHTPLTANLEALPQWRAVCGLLLTSSGTLRKTVNKNQGFPADKSGKLYKEQMLELLQSLASLPGVEAALGSIRNLPDTQHEDDAWQMIATLGQLLKLAVAQLWLVFQAAGEVDFVEIAQRALKALADESGNPTDLALRLDYRIQHLLVDEFQDTSPTQVKLLQQLTRGWEPGDGRTLFAVGDPMQSIYRFRKADVGLFLRVAEAGIGELGLERLRLWRNNRSCAPVIDWINNVFGDIFPAQDSMLQGAISYRPFTATRADEPGAVVQVHPLLAGQWDAAADEENADGVAAESRDSLREREADRIIEIIRQTWAARPTARIAVLVRARTHLHTLVSQIRRHHADLHFQAVEIEGLARRQVVQDLLALTHALHHRADRVHWLAILRAPWCGLTLADLHVLAGARADCDRTIHHLMHDESRLDAMSADGRSRVLHVRAVLDEALQQRGRQSVARWVHAVWLMLGGAECLWQAGDVRDVQAFFERIARLEAAGQFSVAQLVAEVDKLYAAVDADADERLQFMTIHKAKGLEFDTVILPGLDRKTGTGEQPLLLWEEVPRSCSAAQDNAVQTDLVAAPLPPRGQISAAPTLYAYLRQLEAVRSTNEDARVLYVAATRAERCLHLVGAARVDDAGEPRAPKQTFLDMLWPHVGAEFSASPRATTALTLETPLADFVPKLVRRAVPTLPTLFQHRPHAAISTVPHVKADREVPDGNNGRVIGILAHRYLELISRQGVARWPLSRVATLQPAINRWLQQQGVEIEQLPAAAERVLDMLQTTLQSEDGRWVLQTRATASAELPLLSLEEKEARTRRLDLTFIEDGVRWIIDYKSTPLAADMDDQALQRQAALHRDQLCDYARLFVAEGLPTKAAVFFLSAGKLVVLDMEAAA